MPDGSGSRDHTRLIWVYFLLGRILGRINAIWGKNCPKLHCFGTFAGARAHHQGLRWLKPCQFQRNVYWHCEFDKHRQGAAKQMNLVSAFKWQIWKFCDWKTFIALSKPGQRLLKNISNWLEVGVSRPKNIQISQDAMRSDSCWLASWLRLLTKRSYLSSCLTFLAELFFHLSWKQKSGFVMNSWILFTVLELVWCLVAISIL